MHAADALLDQLLAASITDQIDNFCFRFPNEWIFNREVAIQQQAD
jgi:hypothetical protein